MKNTKVEIASGRGSGFKILGRYYRYVEPVVTDPLIRGYFEIMLTVIFVAVCLFFFIRPTSTTIAQLIRKIEDKTKADQELKQKIDDLITAQVNYSKVSDKIVFLQRVLPDKPQVDLLTQDLEFLCKENGLTPLNVIVGGTGLTPDVWKTNTSFKENEKVPLTFNFTVKTDFITAEKLLTSLVQSQRLLNVQVINFSTSHAQSGSELDANFSGVAYFLP